MDYLQYLKGAPNDQDVVDLVLNLVINGLPSILNYCLISTLMT